MQKAAAFVTLIAMILTGSWVFGQNNEVMQTFSDHIKIYHDDAATPHVVASTTYGAFFGYGYCLSRDRMFQLELLRRSTEGTLAEVFGEDFAEADFLARRDAVAYSELEAGLENCGSMFKAALEGFTSGINRAIQQAQHEHFRLDPAFKKAGLKPVAFTPIQVLNIFAGTMAARYNDFTQELDNQHLLSSLVKKFGARTASNIFEDVVFYEDAKVYTTLGEMAYFKPGYRFPSGFTPHSIETEPVYSPTLRNRKRNETLKKVGVPDKSGSYAAVLSRLYQGEKKAWLIGGPQMGYFKPAAVYSIGLHTPEFDLVGTTPVGYILVMFAANRNLGFSATAGVGNLVDIVAATQDPKNENRLIVGEDSIEKQKRVEQIMIKGKKATIREITDTEIGPVIHVEGDTWYIKSRGWKGHVVSSYEGWFDSTFATNLDQWLECSDRNALSINWLGADREGKIAFVHCGLGKSRRSFGDDRLPVSSPTLFPSPDARLAGMNPATGFYANWNCPPVNGYRNGDLQSGWAADQRSRYLADHILINKANWSLDYLKQLDRDLAFTDLRAYFFKDLLTSLVDASMFTPLQQKSFQAVLDWNNLRTDSDGNGKLDDAGAGIFDAWYSAIFAKMFAEPLGQFIWMIGSDSTWTQSTLLAHAILGQSRHNYLENNSPTELLTGCFVETADKLSPDGINLAEFDCPPMLFAGVNHAGAPTLSAEASFTPFMNRGSDVQIMELTPEGIKVFGCMPPGNTSSGNHAEDQVEKFKNFVYQPRALTMKEVRRLNGRFMVVKP
ncbi:MAG: penicillin acylase family protein [Candidatus Rifleibacteriota bacterium]